MNCPNYKSKNCHCIKKTVRFRFVQIQKALSARMEYNTKLEQDDMEGVPDEEWNE